MPAITACGGLLDIYSQLIAPHKTDIDDMIIVKKFLDFDFFTKFANP